MSDRSAGLFLLVVVVVAACSGWVGAPSAPGSLTVSAAWDRPPTGSDRPAAGYVRARYQGVVGSDDLDVILSLMARDG